MLAAACGGSGEAPYAPWSQPPVADNEWFEYRILVSGRTIQTFVNGRLICEYTESGEPTSTIRPAALKKARMSPLLRVGY